MKDFAAQFSFFVRQYVLLVGDLPEALRLHDLGVRVLFGDVDRPETYGLARADRAAGEAAGFSGGERAMKPLANTHHRPQPSFVTTTLKPQSPPQLGDPPIPVEPLPPNPASAPLPVPGPPMPQPPGRGIPQPPR